MRRVASVGLVGRHRSRDADTVPCPAPAYAATTNSMAIATISPTADTLLCDSFAPSDIRPTVRVPSDGRVERLRDSMAKGDWGSALLLAETLLDDDPSCPDARSAQRICRSRLLTPDAPIVLDLSSVPTVAMSMERISSLPLDHRTGFLLSLVDGRSTVDELVDISGLRSREVVEIVGHLVHCGVISLPGSG